MLKMKDGMVRLNFFLSLLTHFSVCGLLDDSFSDFLHLSCLSLHRPLHQEFLSSCAVVKLWTSGRQRCACSSMTCQVTYLATAVRGMSWWCGCSQMKPFTWRWWPRGRGSTSARWRLSWTWPTRADTRCLRLTSLEVSIIIVHCVKLTWTFLKNFLESTQMWWCCHYITIVVKYFILHIKTCFSVQI